MINKDYILRLAEQIGRSLAIILGLRKYNQQEEALIYIDSVLLKTTGMTSRFINSLSEEMLLQIFSPMGILNVESCLWTATLLKAEGIDARALRPECFLLHHDVIFKRLETLRDLGH